MLVAARHPFSIVTKSAGIERDLDLLAPHAARAVQRLCVGDLAGQPTLAHPGAARRRAERRLQTIRRLSEVGVPVGVSVSPVIPFLNEPEIERILEAVAAAGASSAFSIPLRLPWEVNRSFRTGSNATTPTAPSA